MNCFLGVLVESDLTAFLRNYVLDRTFFDTIKIVYFIYLNTGIRIQAVICSVSNLFIWALAVTLRV